MKLFNRTEFFEVCAEGSYFYFSEYANAKLLFEGESDITQVWLTDEDAAGLGDRLYENTN